jgi:LacI family transcriptional regulator
LHSLKANTIFWEQLPGVYEGMKYLIKDLGHKRIGMIRGDSQYHKDRFAGYQIALRTFDIPFDDELVVRTGIGTESEGYSAMKKLLELKELPSAVFVDTDIKALGAMNAIHDAGFKVPDDISILGYDDIPGADELEIPLSTIRVPNYEMGRLAAEMLKRIIENGNDVQNETLYTKLVVRESCAEFKGR